MTKIQSDREIFYGVCRFFSSNAWWRPVIEFIYYNCRLFQQSLEYTTVNEHRIYLKFLNMICDKVDNYMCSKLHITPDYFENLMANFLKNPNDKSQVIFEILRQATNYNEFCKQMHLYNRKIENSITRALLKFAEDESITDKEDLAIKVAEQIEIDQNNEIADLVHQSCVQTKKLLGISPLSANDSISTPIQKTVKPIQDQNRKESPQQIEYNWKPDANKTTIDTSSVSNNHEVQADNKDIKTHHKHHSHHHHSTTHHNSEFEKTKPNIDKYFIIQENNSDNILDPVNQNTIEGKKALEHKAPNKTNFPKIRQSKQNYRNNPIARTKLNSTIRFESPS